MNEIQIVNFDSKELENIPGIKSMVEFIEKSMPEINKEALRYNYFKLEKKKVKTKKLQRDIEIESDPLERELLQLKIDEFNSIIETSHGFIAGCIRQTKNYIDQYNSVRKENNIREDWDEADFEKEEEKYHIKKAFQQALIAARARPDYSIDEGNQIYMSQVGING